MVGTPLNQLSYADLAKAKTKLAELMAQFQSDAARSPGPGWSAVIDHLEEAWTSLDEEEMRQS